MDWSFISTWSIDRLVENENSSFQIDFEFYGSLAPHAAGPLTDRIGRKWTLLSSSIFFISSYILLATTNDSITQIYIARLLQGFAVGIVMTAQTMYVGEISTDEFRGALGSFMQLGITIGIVNKLI